MSAVINALPRIEPMGVDDVDTVLAIECEAHAFPWSRANFSDSLAAGYSAWVCHMDGVLVSYAVMMLVLDEAHLLNITVRPEWQRHGYGMLLMTHLFSTARAHGAQRLFLEMRRSNLAGAGLYRRCGFGEIGLRKDYYAAAAGREDAIVMAAELS